MGMSKGQVAGEWGKAARIEPPVQNKQGQTEVVWHYAIKPKKAESGRSVAKKVFMSGTGFFEDPTEVQYYEFRFLDGRLARWGRSAEEKGSGEVKPAKPGPGGAKPTKTGGAKPTKTGGAKPTKTGGAKPTKPSTVKKPTSGGVKMPKPGAVKTPKKDPP